MHDFCVTSTICDDPTDQTDKQMYTLFCKQTYGKSIKNTLINCRFQTCQEKSQFPMH